MSALSQVEFGSVLTYRARTTPIPERVTMVDKLKRALEGLENPICPNCLIEMEWVRSALTSADTITHLFHCTNCGRAGKTETPVTPRIVPPDKLSAPQRRAA
jgi:hypothetical protein